jgi:hypothetical protein
MIIVIICNDNDYQYHFAACSATKKCLLVGYKASLKTAKIALIFSYEKTFRDLGSGFVVVQC